MTPAEAWSIISANLMSLYKMRKALNDSDKGYTDAETEAEVICFKALTEMQKRSADNGTGKTR